ncbi:MAG: hypothetical protein ACO1RA_11905 [Planctomycetaceae bacterium]
MSEETPREKGWQLTLGKSWGPLNLGAARSTVIEALNKQDFDVDEEEGVDTLFLFEPELELSFAGDAPKELLQIVIEDAIVEINGLPLLNTTLDQALLAANLTSFDGAFWRNDDEHTDTLPGFAPEEPIDENDKAKPPTPSQLIQHATLWIPQLGLGLGMWKGIVCQVVLRKPEHSPTSGIAPLTQEQLELAMQQEIPKPQAPAGPAPLWVRALQVVSNVVFTALIIGLALYTQHRQTTWNQAPRTRGTLVAIEPNDPKLKQDVYVFEYKDQAGNTHQARWTLADIYVPQEIGSEVEVTYLPDAPDKPIGPARVRDIGMSNLFPYIIALTAIGALTNFLLHYLGERAK